MPAIDALLWLCIVTAVFAAVFALTVCLATDACSFGATNCFQLTQRASSVCDDAAFVGLCFVFMAAGVGLVFSMILFWSVFSPLSNAWPQFYHDVYRGHTLPFVCLIFVLAALAVSFYYGMAWIAFNANGAFIIAMYFGGFFALVAAAFHSLCNGWRDSSRKP